MNKYLLYFPILIFILLPHSLKSQETECYYTEKNPISNGYSECQNDILYFTSDINTIVTGEVSANKTIVIRPSANFNISFKPNKNCKGCTNEGEGTTIKFRGGGGGKVSSKVKISDVKARDPIIKLKKNPAKSILEIYNPQNLTIAQYNIYDSFGKKIFTSPINSNEINISHLPTGNYRIALKTIENKTFTLTFIKN